MTFCAFGEKISGIFFGAHKSLNNPQGVAMKAVNGSRLETHLFGNSVPCPESKVFQIRFTGLLLNWTLKFMKIFRLALRWSFPVVVVTICVFGT